MNKFLWGYSNMLNVTFYKNCRLTNTYQEVFFLKNINGETSSTLDIYLNSLTKLTITLNNVYYENNGELILPLNALSNPYQYNYMKIIEYDENNAEILKRYCFINSIECKNGVVYFSYEEDIWSSYGGSIKGCQKSFLERSRLSHYNSSNFSIKELPIEYDGNNELSIEKLFANNVERVVCLVQIQLYQLISGTSEKNIRYNEFILVAPSGENRYDYEIPTMNTVIDALLQNMPSGNLVKRIAGISINFNYQIGNIYYLPVTCFGLNNLTFSTEESFSGIKYKYVELTQALARGITDKSFNISNNYKNLFIGTYDDSIKVKNNGTPIRVSTRITINGINFVWQLCSANEVIDITNSFKYQAPSTPILAEDFAQRRIGIELEEYRLKMQKSRSIVSGTINDVMDMWSSIGKVIAGAFTHTSEKGYGNAVSSAGLLSEGRNTSKSYGNIVDRFSYDVPTINKMLSSISAPKYANSRGNIGNENNIVNYYGLILARINPDNSNYVKESVDNTGYVVYEYIGDDETLKIDKILFDAVNFVNCSATYDFIKFSAISVYGDFTNEIANKLNAILTSGIKIWYSNTLALDNYTDSLL